MAPFPPRPAGYGQRRTDPGEGRHMYIGGGTLLLILIIILLIIIL